MKLTHLLAALALACTFACASRAAQERRHVIPAGGAGFYAIEDSGLQVDPARKGRTPLRVWIHRSALDATQQAEPAVETSLEPGESFDFDAFVGYLDTGDVIHVRLGAEEDSTTDSSQLDFKIVRTPQIPVSEFPADLTSSARNTLGSWSLARDLPTGSPAARYLALDGQESHPLTLSSDATKESVTTFRAPQSGYYALHNASFRSTTVGVEAKLYIDRDAKPRRTFPVAAANQPVSLNNDIGYVAKGGTITLAFTNTARTASAAVELTASLIEWAPRRAPLRVRRGVDGLLDVFEPEAPCLAINVPVTHWITVPAPIAENSDATEAIRRAFVDAAALRKNSDAYIGVRLEPDKTYTIATTQNGGAIFPLQGLRRVVFDGRGSTLLIASPELARREITLFSVLNSREIAFADFTVRATSIPFTTGEVLAVTPPNANTQTVTFRAAPSALDPRGEISRSGQADAYAYDPRIPGRLAVGSWTHYPGRGNPALVPGAEAGLFTHSVTRTNNSIHVGDKWLIKNKRGGVIYLSTRGSTENVTLSSVTGLASGGGHLRFSPNSGINILDCRFEPDGEDWISSSADSVHGRGREGPWIENTLIRGVCEDVMNTYGQSLVVLPDDDPGDAIMSLRLFDGNVESTRPPSVRALGSDSILPGDQLVFFNPKTGRVLGYAKALSLADGRVTLSNSIPDIDTWEPGEGRSVTMVYNTRVAARFFVRDSRIMDSMRFGIYIKARSGVIFGSQFEGLSAPAIFATNEPEWPEGPPATHLWVQGCTFSQNNYGYMPRHRAFMVVDPADISIYTRRLRDPAEPAGYTAHVTRGQFANSHVKLLGNVFHDWRGLGISVRNSRNVSISDNLFLPPVEDSVMRQTLAKDPTLARDQRGRYAAIYLASVDGVRLTNNRTYGLPVGDLPLARDADATAVSEQNNESLSTSATAPATHLTFSEWFGSVSEEAGNIGASRDRVNIGSAAHTAGKLGAGLYFSGKNGPAILSASPDLASAQGTLALWVQVTSALSNQAQVFFAQGTSAHGIALIVDGDLCRAILWRGTDATHLALGPIATGHWHHLALTHDGRSLRGFVDAMEIAAQPTALPLPAGSIAFGGANSDILLARDRTLSLAASPYRGILDEFYRFPRALSAAELEPLAFVHATKG